MSVKNMSVIDGEKEICVGSTTSGKVIVSVGPCEKIIDKAEAEKLLKILASALDVVGGVKPDGTRYNASPEVADMWAGLWCSSSASCVDKT